MKVVEVSEDHIQGFKPFSVCIRIETERELEALRIAAAHMPSDLGIPLYDFLEDKKRGVGG